MKTYTGLNLLEISSVNRFFLIWKREGADLMTGLKNILNQLYEEIKFMPAKELDNFLESMNYLPDDSSYWMLYDHVIGAIKKFKQWQAKGLI